MSRKRGKTILAVDLGGTKIVAALALPQGEIIAKEYVETLAEEGPEAVIRRIIAVIRSVISQAGIKHLTAIGIAAAGALDTQRGLVTASPNLPGWCNVPLADIVQKETGVKTFLLNDANAAALGEHCFGAGRGAKNLVFITVSTGIGGGIIIDNKLYTGTSGAAGEIGHTTIDVDGPRCRCGNVGCLEALASGKAIAREAVRRIQEGERTLLIDLVEGKLEDITAEKVFRAAQEGDTLALEVIHKAATYLGVGLANLVNIFNPEKIVVGGGVAQMGSLLLDPARKVVKERAFELCQKAVSIVPGELGNDAGLLGTVVFYCSDLRG